MTIAANKVDRAEPGADRGHLQAAAELDLAQEIFPVSARTGAGVTTLVDHLVGLLPPGPVLLLGRPALRPDPDRVLAELVREQILSRTREEVPHAVEVEVTRSASREPDLVRIEAVVLTETESQKGILIGAGGRMIKSIGVAARRTIERELGTKVHLELSVRVRRHWRADERLLDRLGIE